MNNTSGTITVSFPVRRSDNMTGFTYIEDNRVPNASGYFGSISASKRTLRQKLESAIFEGLSYLNSDNTHRATIATVHGEVLNVRYFGGGQFGYDITGPNRHGASAVIGYKSFAAALDSARNHAEESFDGIVWQCR